MGELSNNNHSSPKADLGSLSEPTKSELRSGIQAAKAELQSDTNSIKTELKSEIYDIRTDIKLHFNKLDNKLDGLKLELREEIKRISVEVEKLNTRINR